MSSQTTQTHQEEQVRTWGISKLVYLTNALFAVSRPTTQDDNFARITDRFDLYHIRHNCTNGFYGEMIDGATPSIGKLVKYSADCDEEYCMFLNSVRIPVREKDLIWMEKF